MPSGVQDRVLYSQGQKKWLNIINSTDTDKLVKIIILYNLDFLLKKKYTKEDFAAHIFVSLFLSKENKLNIILTVLKSW